MKRLRNLLGELLFGGLVLAALTCSCSKNPQLARLKTEAKRGDPEAQYKLGMYYHEGADIAPDYPAAASWFSKAAAQGYAPAQFAFGEMNLNAEGMLPDEMEAAKWIRKAANQGYAPAQDELATLFSNGVGVMQDDAEAVKWATKAADQGSPDAQYHLGCLLSSNVSANSAVDAVAACMWLSLAAAEGHKEGEDLLETLKTRLSPAQIDEVKRRVLQWKRTHSRPE
ncbi:MAG TPA: tetratricopeptide repeat protein [Verrucomicrobiae bacterium]